MTAATASTSDQPQPMFMSLMRVEFTRAKKFKKSYWKFEIVATILSVLAVLLPLPTVSIATSIAGAAAKALSKYFLSQAKSAFRRAERSRRWDFQHLTLGWPLPSHEIAELLLEFPGETKTAAKALKDADSGNYYSVSGPPGTPRLFSNLAESVFWTEHLFKEMAKRRYAQFLVAILSLVAALIGSYLGIPVDSAATVFKVIAAGTALFVSIDIYGEYSSFTRGAVQARDIFRALVAECKASSISQTECLRLLIEYNCMLTEMPLVPDEIYTVNKPKLDEAWKQAETGLSGSPARSEAHRP